MTISPKFVRAAAFCYVWTIRGLVVTLISGLIVGIGIMLYRELPEALVFLVMMIGIVIISVLYSVANDYLSDTQSPPPSNTPN